MVRYFTPTTPIPAGKFCVRVTVPDDTPWRSALLGALDTLTDVENWVPEGLLSAEDTVQYLQLPILDAMTGGDWCMIGAVWPYASASKPDHTLDCDGTIHLRADYPDLYAALDSTFIVDADNFQVPDLRYRFPLGADPTATPPVAMGDVGGEIYHVLVVGEMPSHAHTDAGHSHGYIPAAPNLTTIGPGAPEPTAIPSVALTDGGVANIQPTGGDAAHNNMPPFVALKWCIVCG